MVSGKAQLHKWPQDGQLLEGQFRRQGAGRTRSIVALLAVSSHKQLPCASRREVCSRTRIRPAFAAHLCDKVVVMV